MAGEASESEGREAMARTRVTFDYKGNAVLLGCYGRVYAHDEVQRFPEARLAFERAVRAENDPATPVPEGGILFNFYDEMKPLLERRAHTRFPIELRNAIEAPKWPLG